MKPSKEINLSKVKLGMSSLLNKTIRGIIGIGNIINQYQLVLIKEVMA